MNCFSQIPILFHISVEPTLCISAPSLQEHELLFPHLIRSSLPDLSAFCVQALVIPRVLYELFFLRQYVRERLLFPSDSLFTTWRDIAAAGFLHGCACFYYQHQTIHVSDQHFARFIDSFVSKSELRSLHLRLNNELLLFLLKLDEKQWMTAAVAEMSTQRQSPLLDLISHSGDLPPSPTFLFSFDDYHCDTAPSSLCSSSSRSSFPSSSCCSSSTVPFFHPPYALLRRLCCLLISDLRLFVHHHESQRNNSSSHLLSLFDSLFTLWESPSVYSFSSSSSSVSSSSLSNCPTAASLSSCSSSFSFSSFSSYRSSSSRSASCLDSCVSLFRMPGFLDPTLILAVLNLEATGSTEPPAASNSDDDNDDVMHDNEGPATAKANSTAFASFPAACFPSPPPAHVSSSSPSILLLYRGTQSLQADSPVRFQAELPPYWELADRMQQQQPQSSPAELKQEMQKQKANQSELQQDHQEMSCIKNNEEIREGVCIDFLGPLFLSPPFAFFSFRFLLLLSRSFLFTS